MKYKPPSPTTPDLRAQFAETPPPPELCLLLGLVDLYRKSLDGNEITITDFISDFRKGRSYHPIGRAVDFRINDMTLDVKIKLLNYMKVTADLITQHHLTNGERIDVVGHQSLWGTANEHFHIEQDNGAPHVPKV